MVRVDELTQGRSLSYLPAGLEWESGDGHAVNGAARTGSLTRREVWTVARTSAATGELDDKALAHELRAI